MTQAAQGPQTQTAAAKAVIQGIVIRAGTGQPLKGARISFRRVGGGDQNPLTSTRTPVTTDATGRFTVTGVDPGQYRISAERDGYIRQEYGQRTTTGSGAIVSVSGGQRLELQFQMLPAGVISGRVSDEQGEPAARIAVQAFAYQYVGGKRSLVQAGSAQTNDIGEYRLFWLSPGEYVVSATVPPAVPGSNTAIADLSAPQTGNSGAIAATLVNVMGAAGGVPDGLDAGVLEKMVQAFEGREPAHFYFPGTLDPGAAAPIKLGPAAEMRAIDFTLRPMRTVTVRGRVVAPFPLAQAGGRGRQGGPLAALIPGQGTQVTLARTGTRAGLAALGFGGTAVNADGSFEVRGVTAGSYNLTATARHPDGSLYTARTRVEVGDADVGNVVIGVRPNVSIRGSIVVDSPPPQFRMGQLRVVLTPEETPISPSTAVAQRGGSGLDGAVPIRLGAANAQVADDGTFTLYNVGAQEYRVSLIGWPPGMYFVSGRLGSTDVLNAPFVPADDERNALQLQLGSTPGQLRGTVLDAKGTPYAGAITALIPEESMRGRIDLYQSIPTDQNGRFSFNNVPPGNYRLFAWEEIPAGAAADPDYIRPFAPRSKPVVVQPGGSMETEVNLIPAN